MLTLEQVRQFLYYEARLLDDRLWDEWLNCYSPQVVYWMPAWGMTTSSPAILSVKFR